MNLKMLTDKQPMKDLILKKDSVYPVLDIIQNTYKIEVPRKQKGKVWHVLIDENEGELVD